MSRKGYDEAFYRERVNAMPFVRRMGMRLRSARDGRSVLECRILPALRNSAGTLHGGAIGALVDLSVATALRSLMPLSARMTTVEFRVNFLRPATEGKVTAHGTILRMGRSLATGSSEVRDDAGELVAVGSATFFLLPGRRGRGAAAIMDRKSGGGDQGR